MTTFYNFALKMETSLLKGWLKDDFAQRMVKSSDAVVYGWLIYSFWDKLILKTCNLKKKKKSKCTKFTKKKLK